MRIVAAALLLVGACAPAAPPPASRAPNTDGLLHAMQACLADHAGTGCTAVDPVRGFVIIKDDDPTKPHAYLIVPDHEVTGIESPAVFQAPVADFWRYGWAFGSQSVTAAPADLGLAINSKAGRTQNLLHIHISCVLPAVREALTGATIGPDWAPAPFVAFGDHAYNARKVASLDRSPFQLLGELPGARERMAEQSLAVVGSGDGGYVLLTDSTGAGVVAEAEELLDEEC